MMVMRNAGNVIQRSLFALLDGAINSSVVVNGAVVETLVNVYDHVSDDAEFPAIHLEGYFGSPGTYKSVDIQDISLDVGIWSKHSGKQEISDIIDKLMVIICVSEIDLSLWGFDLLEKRIASYRSDPESDWGYYGQVTVDFKVQNLQPIL